MLAAGVGVLRARLWTGWHRWVPLAIGVTVFLVVAPGMFAAFEVARLAIGTWMLLFAALGWSLLVEADGSATGETGAMSPGTLTGLP